jgi:hypothetical protein
VAKSRSRSKAASKGWATRRANAAFSARSAAAKKGWATRRRTSAREIARQVLKKPGGRNLRRGKPVAYEMHIMGIPTTRRFDFRGLTKAQRDLQLQNVLRESAGHYARMLIVTTEEELMRGLYPGSVPMRYIARHKPGKPFWFWTSESYIANTPQVFSKRDAAFEEQLDMINLIRSFTESSSTKDVKIAVVELL